MIAFKAFVLRAKSRGLARPKVQSNKRALSHEFDAEAAAKLQIDFVQRSNRLTPFSFTKSVPGTRSVATSQLRS